MGPGEGGDRLSRSVLALLAGLPLAASAALGPTQRPEGIRQEPAAGFAGVRGRVFDAASGRGLPARVEIRNARGEPVASYYEHLPGAFTAEDGSFEVPLPPGRYSVVVHHGIDYLSEKADVEVTDRRGVALEVSLPPA